MDVERVKSPSAHALDTAPAGRIARLDRIATELGQLQSTLAALRRRVARPAPDAGALPRLAALLLASVDARPGTTEFAIAAARHALEQWPGRLQLPPAPFRPRVSLVLRAASAMPALRGLAPGLLQAQAEILVIDDTSDPEIAIWADAWPGLCLISGEDHVAACNLAVAAASAPEIVLQSGPGASGEAWPRPGAGEVLVGPGAGAALARWGIGLGPTAGCHTGLGLALSRTLWNETGGLDPAMADGQGLELADLCLKARLLGARLVPAAGADRGCGGAPSWPAVAAFRARWGDLPFAGGGA